MKPSSTIGIRAARGGEHHTSEPDDLEAADFARDLIPAELAAAFEPRFDCGDLALQARLVDAGATARHRACRLTAERRDDRPRRSSCCRYPYRPSARTSNGTRARSASNAVAPPAKMPLECRARDRRLRARDCAFPSRRSRRSAGRAVRARPRTPKFATYTSARTARANALIAAVPARNPPTICAVTSAGYALTPSAATP